MNAKHVHVKGDLANWMLNYQGDGQGCRDLPFARTFGGHDGGGVRRPSPSEMKEAIAHPWWKPVLDEAYHQARLEMGIYDYLDRCEQPS